MRLHSFMSRSKKTDWSKTVINNKLVKKFILKLYFSKSIVATTVRINQGKKTTIWAEVDNQIMSTAKNFQSMVMKIGHGFQKLAAQNKVVWIVGPLVTNTMNSTRRQSCATSAQMFVFWLMSSDCFVFSGLVDPGYLDINLFSVFKLVFCLVCRLLPCRLLFCVFKNKSMAFFFRNSLRSSGLLVQLRKPHTQHDTFTVQLQDVYMSCVFVCVNSGMRWQF